MWHVSFRSGVATLRTDRDAIWVVESGGPKEPVIR